MRGVRLSEAGFDVVVRSIPGLGVLGADARARVGCPAGRTGVGRYGKYGTQGRDSGSVSSRLVAAEAPERVVATHGNHLPMCPPEDAAVVAALGGRDRERVVSGGRYPAERAGCLRQQPPGRRRSAAR